MASFHDISKGAKIDFPSHGWVANTSGIKHLRLPILRLYQPGQPSYERFVSRGLAGMWVQCRSPYRSLRQLAVALRDLHAELLVLLSLSVQEWSSRDQSEERNTAMTRQREGYERVEISLIAIFTLMRRLADDLMNSSCPLLFSHLDSAPRELKVAIAMVKKGKLDSAGPICDTSILCDALLNHTSWLDRLREEDGIRDILVHKPHILQVGPLGTKELGAEKFLWKIEAHLVRGNPLALKIINLFPALLECIAGACKFMELLYRSIAIVDDYQQGDAFFLTGSDVDIVAFWPPICTSPPA